MSTMNLDKLKRIHDMLDNGKVLVAAHEIYGHYIFWMNQQGNRILHEPLDDKAKVYCKREADCMTEYQFLYMLVWNCFDIYTKSSTTKTCGCCGGISETSEYILIEPRY